MTITDIKNIVNAYGGEAAVLGFGFDNSSGVTFTSGQFTFANNFDEATDVIKFWHYDSHGLPYILVKPADSVQSILFKSPDIDDINIYDRVSIRG